MTRRTGRILRDSKDVVVALRLLVLAGLAMLGIGSPPEYPFLFWFTTCVYGVTNLGYLASRAAHFASPRIQTWIFLFDVLIVSFLIVVRGQQVPQFIMAYFTLVLLAALAQGLGSALWNGLFVCTVYACVTMWGREPEAFLEFGVLAPLAFFVVAAVFMGHVAEVAREEARERVRAEGVNAQLEEAVAARTRDLAASLEHLEAARSRLQASDRLATIGMVAAGVAHDVRNPLAAIRAALDEAPGLLDEVASSGAPEEPVSLLRSAVSDAKSACDALQRLAQDLTAVARAAPVDPRPVPCKDAVAGTARLLKHRAKNGTRIEVQCRTGASALADPGRLQQVLVNLAANGIDAMDDRPEPRVLTLSAEDAGTGRVRFTVADTGPGIPPEARARLFEPFFTTKGSGKGTGLGLHLVQEIARAHDARVEFETEVGRGTRFLVDWPAAPSPAGVPHDLAEDSRSPRGRRGDHPPGAREDAPARAV